MKTQSSQKAVAESLIALYPGYVEGLSSWLQDLKKEGASEFEQKGFPGRKDELWKYTATTPIAETQFQLTEQTDASKLSLSDIQPYLFGREDYPRIVFINGIFSRTLSNPERYPEGLAAFPLKDFEIKESLYGKYFSKLAKNCESSFHALNTAFFRSVSVVHLKKNQVVKEPIHILHLSVGSTNDRTLAHPRQLIVAEANSQATFIESYVSLSKGIHFDNAVTEVCLEDNSFIDYYKILRENSQNLHVGSTEVRQAKNSRFHACSIAFGGRLSRNDLHIDMDAEGAECFLEGLYFIVGKGHVDNHILIDHKKPHGTSHQLYKGVLAKGAKAIFNGKIFVHKDAQKTDASQTNKNLLLTEDAEIDTKPELEIYADDVKAAHGAAVGQIDEKSLFYLKSRGIGEEKARKILSYGFVSEVIERIKVEAVRKEFSSLMHEKLEQI